MVDYLERTPSDRAAGGISGDFAHRASGVSWGAIFAGAAGAASLSLILLLLGTGLGFSSISPWTDRGASAASIGLAAILWLTFTQIAASGMGGFLAGRLRTRWAGVPTDEVYFRDTAHGFLAWSVATLFTAALLTGAVGSIIGTGVKAGSSVVGGAASAATLAGAGAAGAAGNAAARPGMDDSGGPMGYFIDGLFRKDVAAPSTDASATTSNPIATAGQENAASNSEVSRIFLTGIRAGVLPSDDVKYVGQAVARRTGLSQSDAEKRVNDTFAKAQATLNDAQTKAQEAADAARKASAYGALWLVISMLFGAFVASLAATYGGRRRDL